MLLGPLVLGHHNVGQDRSDHVNTGPRQDQRWAQPTVHGHVSPLIIFAPTVTTAECLSPGTKAPLARSGGVLGWQQRLPAGITHERGRTRPRSRDYWTLVPTGSAADGAS